MDTDEGDGVVVGEPHRQRRTVRRGEPLIVPEDEMRNDEFDVATVCVSRARWDAMQAVLAAARYWRQTGYNSEYAGEDELAEAIDRLAAVERRENEPPHLLY